MTIAGKQDLEFSREWQFAVPFMYLDLRRKGKEYYMKVRESKVGIGLQDNKKDFVLSWGGYALRSDFLQVC